MALTFWLILVVTVSAFLMEVVDASIAMGYGTILVPILLIVGFDPFQIVPAVLISQLVGGLLASLFHHKFENVNFAIRGEHLRVAIVLSVLSTMGAVASVFVAIRLSTFYLSLHIGLLTTILGLVIYATHNRRFDFSWRRMMAIGLLAAFNKGMSGGGYGPIITAGQIMSVLGRRVQYPSRCLLRR